MSTAFSEVYDDLWRDWAHFGILREINLNRVSVSIPDPVVWKHNYKLIFVHLLCSLRKAQVNFEKGTCLDAILIDFNEALHSVCRLMEISDTAATYRKQWKTLFMRIQLQCVAVCVIRENYIKADWLVKNWNLYKLLPTLKMAALQSLSDADKSTAIQNRCAWAVFNKDLTKKLKFAYEIPSQDTNLPLLQQTPEQRVQQLKKQVLVDFLKVSGRLQPYVKKRKDLFAKRTKPVSIESMQKVVKDVKQALLLSGVVEVQVDNLVDKIISVCQCRFKRKLEEVL